MIKILHAADLHLDSVFSGHSQTATAWLRAQLKAIPEQIAAICKNENCDLLLLAGDVFDGKATKESCLALGNALEEVGIPTFISPGNHDFCAPGSPWLEERWPENVHIFTGAMESVVLPELDCRVYGAGYRSMDCPSMLEGFHADGEERFCVAVLHGDPTNASSPNCPVTMSQIRDSGLDYLAMGHIHRAGMFHAGGTICAWPGCPMGRGYDELEERGVYVTWLGDGYDVKFVPLNTLRFHELTLPTGEDAIEELEKILPGFGNHDFYRITLTGSGCGEMADILDHFQHLPNLELRDQRRDEAGLWDEAGQDSLRGAYFQRLKDYFDTGDEETHHTALLAAEISRQLLEGREVDLP